MKLPRVSAKDRRFNALVVMVVLHDAIGAWAVTHSQMPPGTGSAFAILLLLSLITACVGLVVLETYFREF